MRRSHIVLIALVAAAAAVIAGCSHVGEDWKAAQATDTTEAYQDFLRQHPDSEFVVPAQERVKQLAEDRDWQQASKTDTLDAYQQFVATHADGKWAQEARVRIENFQLTASAQPVATDGAAPTSAAPGTTAAPAVEPVPPAAKSAAPVAAKPTGKHLAQLGAYGSREGAESAWRTISGRFPTQLKSLQPHYVVVTRLHAKPLVRLQIALASAQRAQEVCAALKKKSQACVPLD